MSRVAGVECESTRAPEVHAELIGRAGSQALVRATVGALLVDLEGDLWGRHPCLQLPWSLARRRFTFEVLMHGMMGDSTSLADPSYVV